jgi:FAD synthase
MTSENTELLKMICPGVYIGTAEFVTDPEIEGVEAGQQFIAAMNVGWCPKYDNKEKTFEVYFIKEFPTDFYG